MKLSSYTELIKQLPYEQQAFETAKETWQKDDYGEAFNSFCNRIFKGSKVSISRGELFNLAKSDFTNAIFSIILWGYPRGYTRGNTMGTTFPKFLKEGFPILEVKLVGDKNLTKEDYSKWLSSLKGKGVGRSTLTKFLYFFNFHVDSNRCLILDSRILDVIKKGAFEELTIKHQNEDSYYFNYLKLMRRIAKENGYTVDQLELFLFMFGNNLKD